MNGVKYNFIMLKNEMESYVRLGGKGFEQSYVPLHGVGEGQKLQKSSLINEWLLIDHVLNDVGSIKMTSSGILNNYLQSSDICYRLFCGKWTKNAIIP